MKIQLHAPITITLDKKKQATKKTNLPTWKRIGRAMRTDIADVILRVSESMRPEEKISIVRKTTTKKRVAKKVVAKKVITKKRGAKK